VPDKQPTLAVAVAQPVCRSADLAANAREHADAVRAAGAQLVIFPELSLTGYELDDAPAVSPDDPRLAPLVESCAATGAVALAGAPIRGEAGSEYIATLEVTGAGLNAVYRKIWLGADEQRRFAPGTTPVVLELAGWRVGLAICKDTSILEHHHATAAEQIDVYAAGLVMHDQEADELASRGHGIARELGTFVAFASFAGQTGSGYSSCAGRSAIWDPTGSAVAAAGPAPGEVAVALLPRPRG
jgi:predicted amidohydrolase